VEAARHYSSLTVQKNGAAYTNRWKRGRSRRNIKRKHVRSGTRKRYSYCYFLEITRRRRRKTVVTRPFPFPLLLERKNIFVGKLKNGFDKLFKPTRAPSVK